MSQVSSRINTESKFYAVKLDDVECILELFPKDEDWRRIEAQPSAPPRVALFARVVDGISHQPDAEVLRDLGLSVDHVGLDGLADKLFGPGALRTVRQRGLGHPVLTHSVHAQVHGCDACIHCAEPHLPLFRHASKRPVVDADMDKEKAICETFERA